MKNILTTGILFCCGNIYAQQNTFLSADFWKSKPNIETVRKNVSATNSLSEKNAAAFDPVVLAINNKISTDVIIFMIEQPGNNVHKITHDGRTYLHWAAMSGNKELVAYLIKKGSDVNLEDSKGASPLTFAINAGNVNPEILQLFFDAGVSPSKKYKNSATLMMLSAAFDENGDVQKLLQSKGLQLTDKDENGATVFDYAAAGGNFSVLKKLLQIGVKPTNNAILFAAQGTRSHTNTVEVYRFLVENLQLNANVQNKSKMTALHLLAKKNNQQEQLQYLISKGANTATADSNGNTALMLAASGKDVKNVTQLFSQNAKVNLVNNEGKSALTFAVESGSPEIVDFLLSQDASVQISDKNGNSLLYYLMESYRGNQKDPFEKKLNALQKAGLQIHHAEKNGNTLYHMAVMKNDPAIFEVLDFQNININAANNEKMTALHKAALLSADTTILKYLLAKGADKTILTEFDESAYDLASENEALKKNNVSLEFLK